MPKKIIIYSCNVCPRRQFGRSNSEPTRGAIHTCAMTGHELVSNDLLNSKLSYLMDGKSIPIPEWCPLEDA